MRRAAITSSAVLLVLLAAHACSSPEAGGDSESHFLEECATRCAGGLECLCGVCTKPCVASDQCTDLFARAECVAASDGADCGGGAPKTCDVACLTNEACSGLGVGFACAGGRCREGTGTDASVEASSGGGGTNAGGVANAGGGPNTGGVGGAPPETCVPRATYPEPPTSVVTAGGSVEIVAVQYTADFGDVRMVVPGVSPKEYLSVGFDLDAQCTTEANVMQGTCTLPSYSQPVLDGPGGRDNAFGAIIQQMRSLTSDSFSSENYTIQLQRGATNLIFRITEYNGEANDDQVRLDALSAAPYATLGDAGTLPRWDGNDVWPVSSNSVVNLDRTRPQFSDVNAYVTENKVVASLPKFGVPLDIGLSALGTVRWTFELSGAFVVCDIRPTGVGRWGRTLDKCVVGGRIVADDIVHQLSAFPDPLLASSGGRLCTSSPAYKAVRNNLCELVDLYSDPAALPAVSCNALSFGMGFDMQPGNVGDVVSVEPVPPGCTDETDPVHDSCANYGVMGGTGGASGAGGMGAGDGG